jgi:outer membrane protein TolC
MTASRRSPLRLSAPLLGLLLAAGPALGAPLAYEDALKLALERNPALLGADQDLRSAQGALLAAKGVFDPNLTAGFNRASSLDQGLTFGFPTTTENRSGGWDMGVNKYFATGTSAALNWTNGQNKTLYSAENTERLDQVRQLGFLNEDELYTSRLTATVTQPLLEGFRMATNLSAVRTARSAETQAEAERARVRQQTLSDTAKAYWALHRAGQLHTLARASLEVAREEQRVVEAKVAEGSLAPLERARVAAVVVQAESALMDAGVAERQASDALQLLVGGQPGEPVEATTPPAEVLELPIDAAEAVRAALAQNPSLQAQRLRVDNGEQDLGDARHRMLPQLDATASYGLAGFELGTEADPTNSVATAASIFDGEQRSWSVGANLSVPMGNRAARGGLDQRGAALQRLKLDEQALARSIEQQVRAQVDTLRAGRTRVALAEANLRFAEETLNAERALQATGRTVQQNVLTAIKNVDDAKVALQQARSDHLVAIIELERLKGSL